MDMCEGKTAPEEGKISGIRQFSNQDSVLDGKTKELKREKLKPIPHPKVLDFLRMGFPSMPLSQVFLEIQVYSWESHGVTEHWSTAVLTQPPDSVY